MVTFHLKRFGSQSKQACANSDKELVQLLKLSKKISFPETLDLTPFVTHKSVSPIPRDNKYSLFAVVNHDGTSVNGHYITFIRQQNGCWYECNDSTIIPVTTKTVLSTEA